ncbi:hypothetical protein EMPS_00036 [Entomortierella parvispora]|uniref:F-box domain-containing protein n=1 Tax=Entomortierella parvispora TaxID=205924 RepID=A0A9P3LRL6_9FUNG|nr:hypothetical protein EMPS_00036 [Entomortierella parvispora]
MPDFIVPGLSPLEIPEVIAMVGQQIPLTRQETYTDHFNPALTGTRTVFAARDLVACTAVSRKWRWVLLPILWRQYDGPLMRHVPRSILQANSEYWRSFRDRFGHHHVGPFFTTNLRQLVISQQHDWAVPFITSNTLLCHLTWTGLGTRFSDVEFSALSVLSNLRDLSLSNWNLDGRQLAVVLCANPKLVRLSLGFVDGVLNLDGMLILFALEEISLGYIPPKSQSLLELARYCPSLQRISFLGTWTADQPRDLVALSNSLLFCCPDLCSIHFSASYCFATNDFDTLEDFEYAALIHSSKALGNFAAEVAGLGRLMTDSLISHFDSLVSVDLCIRRRYQYTHDGGGGGVISRSIDIANTARILSSCSRLRIFRLSSAENVIEMRAALELFSLPWACLGLEILSLSQILLPNLNSKQERGGRSTATAPAAMSSLRAFGWHPQSKSGPLAACTQSSTTTSREALVTAGIPSPPNFALTTTPNSAAMAATLPTPSPLEADDDLWRFGTEFKCKLLPQVSSLKVLKELCLNKVIYARTAVA